MKPSNETIDLTGIRSFVMRYSAFSELIENSSNRRFSKTTKHQFNAKLYWRCKRISVFGTRISTRPRQKNIQSRVVVHFIVNEDGTISNVEVERSSDNAELDEEAMRVVRGMPKWKPGTQDGEPVKVNFWLPITFQLK